MGQRYVIYISQFCLTANMGTLCYCARLQHVPRFILLVHRAKTGCKTFYLWPMPDYYEYFQWQISKKNLGIKI